MKTNIHFWPYLSHFFLEWKMLKAKFLDKVETHILCSLIFFLNRDFYQIMWKNIVEQSRPQVTI